MSKFIKVGEYLVRAERVIAVSDILGDRRLERDDNYSFKILVDLGGACRWDYFYTSRSRGSLLKKRQKFIKELEDALNE